MIRCVIFDLDNCLAPAREVGAALYEPALQAIRDANDGSVSEAQLEEAFRESWRHPLDWIAAKYQFTEAMRVVAWEAFAKLRVAHPMEGYGDLAYLSKIPVPCDLVTSGFRGLQESKIQALGLNAYFRHTLVDAVDELPRYGKLGWFRKIWKQQACAAHEVLVVGDNPESELAAGNELGMLTVQTLRPGVEWSSVAQAHVRDLSELVEWMRPRWGES